MLRRFAKTFNNVPFFLVALIIAGSFVLSGGASRYHNPQDNEYKTKRASFADKSLAKQNQLQIQEPNITILPTVPLPTPTPKPGDPTTGPGTPTPASGTPTPGSGGTPPPGSTVTPTPIVRGPPPIGGCPLGICPPTATPTPSGPPPRPVCNPREEKRDDCDCGILLQYGMTCPGTGKDDCYFGIIGYECDASYTAPGSGCFPSCVPKPVIYLYPTEKTNVSVTVTTTGKIVVSKPLYPKDGWKNIEAYPDGHFLYEGKEYHELFYETGVLPVREPESGTIIPTVRLRDELTILLRQLGLIPVEQLEFLDFWIPRLEALKTPYIFFSIVDADEKQRVDRVDITPQPDTMIEFIAYFRGIETTSLLNKPPLLLPDPPKRIGFTAVEWGGTIAGQ